MEGKEEEVSQRKGRKAIKVKPKGHDVDQWKDRAEEKAESSRTSRQDSHNCPIDTRESQRQKKKKSKASQSSTNNKSSNSKKVDPFANVSTIESLSELLRYEVSITKNALPGSSAALQSEDAVHQRSPNKEIRYKIFLWLVPRIQRDWAQHNPNDRLEVYHNRSQLIVNRRLNSKFIQFEYQIAHQELEDGPSEISYKVVIADAELKVNIPKLEIALDDLKTSTEPDDLNIFEQLYNISLKNIGGDVCLPCRRSFDFEKRGHRGLTTHCLNGLFDWQEITDVHTTQSSWISVGIKGCRGSQSVNDAVKGVLGDSASNWKDVRTWRKREFRAVSDFLKSCKVRIEIDGEIVDKVVRDILRLPAADVSIKCPEFGNKDMTAPQYYLKKFGIKVENTFGLLLQIGETTNVPAELCTIIETPNYSRLLTKNFDDSNRQLQTTQTPRERRESRIAAVDDLLMTDHPILKDFTITRTSFSELKETRMKKDEIFSQRGEWDHWDHEVKFFDSVVISSWAILILDDTSNIRPENFIRVIQKVGKEDGMNIPDPIRIVSKINIQDKGDHKQNVANIADILIKWKKEFKWTTNMNTFIIVVLPHVQSSLYNQTKEAAGLDAGVCTKCIIKENFEQANPNVVKNILLKLKCQLGGNHVSVIPKDLVKVDILKTPVMIVGIHINTHFRRKGSTISKLSFAVVTASTDRSGMPYLMSIQAQQTEEGAVVVVQDLDIIIEKMLKKFMAKTQKQNNGIPITPSKIIVYRDVFGGEQFPEVLDVEMRAIRKACKNFQQSDGKPYRPKITIITLEKLQKVRVILQKRDKCENAPPGTVVDTAHSYKDYLRSYKDAQVTSVPTHYQVLWDDSNFSADEIQALTYFLCNMYSLCNKAVSYPAPTYYAQWAAKRAIGLRKINDILTARGKDTPDFLK